MRITTIFMLPAFNELQIKKSNGQKHFPGGCCGINDGQTVFNGGC